MKKILVIDDVAGNRDIFTSLLEGDYLVLEAEDGRQGLEVAEAEQPDLIFLDLSMRGMGGLEMISRLRKHATLYPVPVVAVTAHSAFSAKKAVDSGCNDYLLKPLAPNKIMEKIEKWLD
ncbi:MAG: response regulator [Candidatus Glassbacteria bacterium]|nr:response regulator [Candidatus Glassbacteria bacterium]